MAEKYKIKLRDDDIDLSKMGYFEKLNLARSTKDIDTLRKLANDEYWDVRSDVAENPNTPVDILIKLSEDKSTTDIRRGVAKNLNTPVDILRKLSKDEYGIREAVASNPNTPLSVLKELAKDKYEDMREVVKHNPTYKEYVKSLNLDELNKLDKLNYMNREERTNLAESTKDIEILKKLSEDERWKVREAVAKNINTPIEILIKMSRDEDEDVRREVKNNPNYSIKKTNKKASKENIKIIKVENGGYSPGEAIIKYTIKINNEKLYVFYRGYETEDIQQLINSDVFEEYCSENNKDEDEVINNVGNSLLDWETNGYVRIEEAIEEALEDTDFELSEEETNTIVELINDSLDKDIKKYWGWNQAVVNKFNKWYTNNDSIKDSKLRDEEIDLKKMYMGKKEYLAETTKDVNILRKLAKDEDHWVRAYVAENPNAPEDVLRELVDDKEYLVRRDLALNPNCPADVFRQLAEDTHSWVRRDLASNPDIPVDVLIKLANDEEYSVVEIAIKNPNWNSKLEKEVSSLPLDKLSSSARLGLALNTKDINLLKQLSEYEDSTAQKGVAYNPNCPEDVLEKLANHKYYEVRRAVAENPNTPVDALRKLAKDEVNFIRKYAKQNKNYSPEKIKKISKEPISLNDIEIGKCRTYNEAEVQQAYYFIFHTMIPIFVKGEKFVLSNSWFTGDREDVYDDLGEYGENIPWKELTDEAESSDNWCLISASERDYICNNDSLEDCLETLFEDYSISKADFNKVKNEILKENKLNSYIEGETDYNFINCALEDSDWKHTSKSGREAKKKAKENKPKRNPRGPYNTRTSSTNIRRKREDLTDAENRAYDLISKGADLNTATADLVTRINSIKDILEEAEDLTEYRNYKQLIYEGNSKLNDIKRYYDKFRR